MDIKTMKVCDLKVNDDNPRDISDENLTKLVESIKSFPEMLKLRPLVIDDDNTVIGGNMRLLACKRAGMVEVPVVHADGLSDEQKREFIIKDNVGFGEWNWEQLKDDWDIGKLKEWGLDIDWDDKDDDLLGNQNEDKDDFSEFINVKVNANDLIYVVNEIEKISGVICVGVGEK